MEYSTANQVRGQQLVPSGGDLVQCEFHSVFLGHRWTMYCLLSAEHGFPLGLNTARLAQQSLGGATPGYRTGRFVY
jgi:hypothetical protein